jgi:hypothetical protein
VPLAVEQMRFSNDRPLPLRGGDNVVNVEASCTFPGDHGVDKEVLASCGIVPSSMIEIDEPSSAVKLTEVLLSWNETAPLIFPSMSSSHPKTSSFMDSPEALADAKTANPANVILQNLSFFTEIIAVPRGFNTPFLCSFAVG